MKNIFSLIKDLGIAIILAISFPICVHLGINVFYPQFQDLESWNNREKKFLTTEEFKRLDFLKQQESALKNQIDEKSWSESLALNNLKAEKETKENVEKIHAELKALRDAIKPINKEQTEIHYLLTERFKKLSEERSSVVFYVSLFTALLLIGISLFIPVPAISVGLILSGIAVGIDGYWRTWNYLDARLKFISLIIAIVLLIAISFISFYRSKDKKRKK